MNPSSANANATSINDLMLNSFSILTIDDVKIKFRTEMEQHIKTIFGLKRFDSSAKSLIRKRAIELHTKIQNNRKEICATILQVDDCLAKMTAKYPLVVQSSVDERILLSYHQVYEGIFRQLISNKKDISVVLKFKDALNIFCGSYLFNLSPDANCMLTPRNMQASVNAANFRDIEYETEHNAFYKEVLAGYYSKYAPALKQVETALEGELFNKTIVQMYNILSDIKSKLINRAHYARIEGSMNRAGPNHIQQFERLEKMSSRDIYDMFHDIYLDIHGRNQMSVFETICFLFVALTCYCIWNTATFGLTNHLIITEACIAVLTMVSVCICFIIMLMRGVSS